MSSARLSIDLRRILAAEEENLRAYTTVGSQIFDKISKIIKSKSQYRISRELIAGSIGKNTSLGYNFEPDFDVILFVGGVTHFETLEDVSDDFYTILKNLPSQCQYWTRFAMQPRLPNGSGVQFSVDTDIMLPSGRKRVTIEFDLLPAYDFSSNVDDQTRAVLERLRASWNLERDILRYSGSLSEKKVEFVKNKSHFVRSTIRLAKLWNVKLKEDLKRRGRDLFLPGKSPIIELIAIKAAELSNGDILNAFRKFLTLMEGMNRININFSNQDRYPFAVMKIVDAVNPYCNFADGLDTTHVNNFVTRASDTLKALDRVENSGYGFHDSNALKNFMDFFATAA